MVFNVNHALTTPAGYMLDERFFLGYDNNLKTQSRRNKIDREARALIATVQKNVVLFRSNIFYVQGRPSLRDHIMGLLDRFLDDPRTHTLIAKNDPMIASIIRMIAGHDNNETILEEQSFAQKSNPTLKSDALEKFFSEYKDTIAFSSYHLAQCYAASGNPEAYLDTITAIQMKYAAFSGESEKLEKTPKFYAQYAQETLRDVMRDVQSLSDRVYGDLNPEDQELIRINDQAYMDEYRKTEDPNLRATSIPALVAKSVDKNCSLYVKHDWSKGVDYPGPKLEREPSPVYIKTAKRSLEYLPTLHTLTENTPAGIYFNIVSDMAHRRVAEYTKRQKPVIALTDRFAQQEPVWNLDERIHIEFRNSAQEMLKQRRQSITHPLEDTHVMARDEIVAKLMTQQHYGGAPDTHLFSNDFDYRKKNGYVTLYNRNLKALRTSAAQYTLFS